MRAAVLVLLLLCVGSAKADEASQFLDKLCVQGFGKTSMPKADAVRFCACVIEDVIPRLSGEQRRVVAAAKADHDSGRAPSPERLVVSGVRDLVVAGQARCEAAYYPPTKPINVTTGALELTLRCNLDTRAPETFVYSRGMALLSKAELRALDQRMMNGTFDPEYA